MNGLENTFPGQLWHALTTNGFKCALTHDSSVDLPVLEMATMRLLPISLSTWNEANHHAFLVQAKNWLTQARAAGCQAVVVWEDYWLSKPAIVLSRLSAMLGVSVKIPARLTQVRRISNAETNGFLNANHLNGTTVSKFRYGLFLPQRYYRVLPEASEASELLVAVATFSNARIFEQNNQPFRSHELIRFASLAGSNVVGGLDKLLNAFVLEKSPDDIMTYADQEWSDGRSYRRLGFEARGETGPREFFVDPADMVRIRKAGERDCISVYNLGSIKFVKIISNA